MTMPTQDIHPICKMRSGIVCLALLLGFSLIGGRLFYLQVFQSAAGAHEVQRQHQKTVVVNPDRGVIVDRQGHPLALNVDLASVFVNPSALTNPRKTAKTLSGMLEMPAEELRTLFQSEIGRRRVGKEC